MTPGDTRGSSSRAPARTTARPSTRLSVAVAVPDGAVGAARGLGAWLAAAAPARARGEMTVAIVSDGRMQVLNRTYRGKDRATDVLSFPETGPVLAPDRAGSRAPVFLGDVVIASGVAARQAREAGHSFRTELRILALHGLLHLLGYDHEADAGEMSRLEQRLRRKAGLPTGLIERELAEAARRPPPRRSKRDGRGR